MIEIPIRSILDSMPANVAVIDQTGTIVQVNAAWNEYALANGGDLARCGVGVNYLEVCRRAHGPLAEGAPECLAGLEALLNSASQSFDLEYPCPSHDLENWFLLRAAPVRGRDAMAVIAHINITAQKRAEEALRAADRRKDEFLAMLAHELRNPLAPIMNAVQILQLKGTTDPWLERHCQVIGRQASHMARLLNDLLDISRITRGKIILQRQPLTLADALTRAVEVTLPLIEGRHQTLTVFPPPADLKVEADLDRLAQVFGNLLANASKYTGEGGMIRVTAGREGFEAVVRVSDTGVGIDAQMLPYIFDLFAQAEKSLERAQGGLGIGLTMVKNLVQLHGGRVEAHSAGLGQGSEFVVRLPLPGAKEMESGEAVRIPA